MREVELTASSHPSEATTFAACLATILELPLEEVPEPLAGEDVPGWRTMRWLGGLGLGLVPVADAASFSWAGPWIGRVRPSGGGERRAVVMYGVPSGVAWDPSGATDDEAGELDGGFAVSALDIALARPALPDGSVSEGTVEAIFIAPAAGAPAQQVESVRALAGQGLEGDRHVAGRAPSRRACRAAL